jgi:hypothetical protein
MAPPAAQEQELRAKYLDWCSARLADRFLALSPDEIYELAERASHGREDAHVAIGASGSAAWPINTRNLAEAAVTEPENFRILIARVTEVLAETLPTYEDWVEAYQADPARYDEELLGFWREKIR